VRSLGYWQNGAIGTVLDDMTPYVPTHDSTTTKAVCDDSVDHATVCPMIADVDGESANGVLCSSRDRVGLGWQRAQSLTRSVRTLAADHGADRLPEDHRIERERPVLYILQI
jgi:hypothetical protein